MNCPNCGTPVSGGALVCPQCHTAVAVSPAPVPAAAPQFAAAAPARAPIPVYSGPQEPCGKAKTSMILGIAGVVLSIVLIGIPLGIIAVILGHLALSEIKRSGGRLQGRNWAITGLITGYICVAFILLMPVILIMAAIAIPNLLHARMAANDASAAASLRQLNTAILSYQERCDNRLPDSLAKLGPSTPPNPNSCDTGMGLVDATLTAGQKAGYVFSYEKRSDSGYVLNADPVKFNNTGSMHFFTDESNIIRSDKTGPANGESPPL